VCVCVIIVLLYIVIDDIDDVIVNYDTLLLHLIFIVIVLL